MEMSLKEMGNYLRELRENKGLSTREVYELSKVSNSYLSLVENGHRRASAVILRKLAPVYGVDYLDLYVKAGYADLAENERLKKQQVYLCPVYGKIKAGEPNWAEQNIEGRILVPITPENTHPEDCFYLRVDGNSMNKVVKDRDYALIQKQDYAEDGDYVVALVNGYNATLKKYKRLNEQFILLEPVSEDSTFQAITVDLKTTGFKILGKMIAHFGFTK